MLTLSRPYAGPILPLCWPYLGLRLPHHVSKFTRTKSKHRHMSFCPFRGTPWTRSLTLGWPYLAPMLAPACPYVGPILALCRPIVATNLPELGQNTFDMSIFSVPGDEDRRQGRLATITFGYQPKDTGWPSWPAPGFKGLRLTAGRRPKGPYVRLG